MLAGVWPSYSMLALLIIPKYKAEQGRRYCWKYLVATQTLAAEGYQGVKPLPADDVVHLLPKLILRADISTERCANLCAIMSFIT